MSAWIEGDREEKIKDIDKKFEDDFAPQNDKSFQKLDDSADYLKLLGKIFYTQLLNNNE